MNRTVRRSAAFLLMMGLTALTLPASAATPVEEAQALISQGDLDGALKRIDRYLSGSPQDAEGRFTRALILVKQNNNAEAIKAFTELTRDYPQLPEPYNNLAVLYAQTGNYEKARDALEAALATNPSYATAHENLGDIYAALAGAAYNRALALDANNASTRYKLSLLSGLTNGGAGRAAPVAAPAPVAAAATPTAAAPAPVAAAPVAVEPTAPASSDAVLRALEVWARAWSARDVDAYLAAYSSEFRPDGGLAIDEWQLQRRTRIGKAKMINVELVAPEVQAIDAKHVRVLFTQDYSSDTISDKVGKIIEMAEVGGTWKIVRETTR